MIRVIVFFYLIIKIKTETFFFFLSSGSVFGIKRKTNYYDYLKRAFDEPM